MKSIRQLFHLLCLLGSLSGFETFGAQPRVEWSTVYSPITVDFSDARFSQVDVDGNVYVGSTSYGPGGVGSGYNYEVAKFNPRGEPVWVGRQELPDYLGGALAMTVDEAGQVLITGPSGTAKLNADGSAAWRLPITGVDVEADASGNVLLAGFGSSLHKFNAAGRALWVREHDATVGNGFGLDDYGRRVAVDRSGAIYVIGTTGPFHDWVTIKFDEAGHQLWMRTYDTPDTSSGDATLRDFDDDIPQDLILDKAGNLIVTGVALDYAGEILYELEFRDTLTIKYDSEGQVVWTARLPRAYGYSKAALDQKGNLYLVRRDGIEDEGFYSISKLDDNGKPVWTVEFTAFFSWATGFAVDKKGHTYLAASLFAPPTSPRDSILKFDADGRELWTEPFGTGARSLRHLGLDRHGKLYAIGVNSIVKYVEGR